MEAGGITGRRRRLLFLLLVVPPAAILLVWIVQLSVNVPTWDEWQTPGELLQSIAEGRLSPEHVLSHHNESRKVIPKLLYAAAGSTVGWCIPHSTLLTWLLIVASALLLVRMFPVGAGSGAGSTACLIFSVYLLVFSPVQHDNLLMGLQFIVFVPPLCILAALSVQRSRPAYPARAMLCALFAVIATFTYANGLLCWILCAPVPYRVLLAWRSTETEEKIRTSVWLGIYAAAGCLSILLSFRGYTKPEIHPSLDFVLDAPVSGIRYFLIWLGAPHAYLPQDLLPAAAATMATIFGGIILAAVLTMTWITVRSWAGNRPERLELIPWLILSLYGVLSGVLTTIGRAGFGLAQALSLRYTTFSIWAAIGCIGFLAAWWQLPGRRPGKAVSANALRYVVAAVLIVVAIVPWVRGREGLKHIHHVKLQNLLTLRLLNVVPDNPMLKRLNPEDIRDRANVLIENSILDVSLIGDWLSDGLRDVIRFTDARMTAEMEPNRRLRIEGEVVLPPGIDTEESFVLACNSTGAGTVRIMTGMILERDPRVEIREAGPVTVATFGDRFIATLGRDDRLLLYLVDPVQQTVYGIRRVE